MLLNCLEISTGVCGGQSPSRINILLYISSPINKFVNTPLEYTAKDTIWFSYLKNYYTLSPLSNK